MKIRGIVLFYLVIFVNSFLQAIETVNLTNREPITIFDNSHKDEKVKETKRATCPVSGVIQAESVLYENGDRRFTVQDIGKGGTSESIWYAKTKTGHETFTPYPRIVSKQSSMAGLFLQCFTCGDSSQE